MESIAPGRHDPLISYFWSGDLIRSRSVGHVVLAGRAELPVLPARLVTDWEREVLRLGLEPGDVEALPLARTQARWPDYKQCVQAAANWTRAHGLGDVLAQSDMALMACRGAKYHHDAAHYGRAAFCNLFLSDDKGLDLHFSMAGLRIALVPGTLVVFDTGQPHAVISRTGNGFCAADFSPERDCTQVFLTWELPIEASQVAHALGVTFDLDPMTASQRKEEQVCRSGVPAKVCVETGQWL